MAPVRNKTGTSSDDDDKLMLDGTRDDKPKRKRQSQSCDACRSRKVRCARDNPDDQTTRCKHCISLGVPCTYDYQPKKRGPPNLYLRRLQEAAALAQREQGVPNDGMGMQLTPNGMSANGQNGPHGVSPLSPHSMAHVPLLSHSHSSHHLRRSPPSIPNLTTPVTPGPTSYLPDTPLNPHAPAPIPPSRYPIAADTYNNPPTGIYGSHHHHFDRPSTADTSLSASSAAGPPPSAIAPPSLDNPFSHSFNATNGSNNGPTNVPAYQSWTSPPGSIQYPFKPYQPPPPTYLPPLNYYYRPHRLEDIAPREMLLQIIQLFFDFVYPLTPCVHRPSFMADLSSRREERDPLFYALVMSTIASTLVQVPRSCLPIVERKQVRRLAQLCHEASRHVTVAAYDPPTSTHVVIRYFDTVYHFCEGHDATSHASFGEAAHIAVTLHMHEEASYEGLDPIETEVRRRVFWLLFGADKSMSILLGRPICLRDEDCTLHFPKEVDDEYITATAILPQPAGKTAIVSGLNYITRIFALLGEILVRIRVDKRSPPQGPFATARLEEVRSLHARILGALAHAPAPLRLKSLSPNGQLGGAGVAQAGVGAVGASSVGPAGSPVHPQTTGEWPGGAGFRQATFAEVREFFDNPKASRANAMNAFLVMQANLYVTQQLVRFVIEQYRDELMLSMHAATGEEIEITSQEDREAVASDLLNVLHSIPIQSIAVNGPSLVHKVRFVASTLLDTVRKAETAPVSAARAHAYLWDFLSILSEIERNYLLDDDADGGSNGDGVPLLGNA
ncbi:hypothetical protein FRC15_009960 [Serendipita sp. 397]|nr:hypothetical protein FRC15_009960 [Serendipita sp. 397]KAG8838760.1 hypothetical protein FRC18_002826 [Serendipita sp. 400]